MPGAVTRCAGREKAEADTEEGVVSGSTPSDLFNFDLIWFDLIIRWGGWGPFGWRGRSVGSCFLVTASAPENTSRRTDTNLRVHVGRRTRDKRFGRVLLPVILLPFFFVLGERGYSFTSSSSHWNGPMLCNLINYVCIFLKSVTSANQTAHDGKKIESAFVGRQCGMLEWNLISIGF